MILLEICNKWLKILRWINMLWKILILQCKKFFYEKWKFVYLTVHSKPKNKMLKNLLWNAKKFRQYEINIKKYFYSNRNGNEKHNVFDFIHRKLIVMYILLLSLWTIKFVKKRKIISQIDFEEISCGTKMYKYTYS